MVVRDFLGSCRDDRAKVGGRPILRGNQRALTFARSIYKVWGIQNPRVEAKNPYQQLITPDCTQFFCVKGNRVY